MFNLIPCIWHLFPFSAKIKNAWNYPPPHIFMARCFFISTGRTVPCYLEFDWLLGSTILQLQRLTSNHTVTCKGYPWWITGSGLDDCIYWHFSSLLQYCNQQSAIDVHTFKFTVAQALGFSVSTSRLLATDLNTETSTSNHYEVFLSFLVQPPWNSGTQLKLISAASGLTLYSLGADNAENTVLLLRCADHTRNTSQVIVTQLVHWLADCCLATRYNIRPLGHSFSVARWDVFTEPLPGSVLIRYDTILSNQPQEEDPS
jgi:hypothetical protein